MRHLGAFLVLFAFSTLPALAQVDSSTARQLGMESAWRAQIQMPGMGKGLVSSHLWADQNKVRQYAVVELPGRTIRIAADTPDRDGNPIGLDEAKEQAQQYASRLLGKPDGFEVVEVSVPQINLVLVTSDGLVQNLDAETGKLIWSSACGHSRAPAFPAAVSAFGVAVVQGDELHVIDWDSGKHKVIQRLRNSTSNAVALCNDQAFISDFTGQIEAYGLGEPLRPWSYVISGHVVGAPVTLGSNDFCAMASDNGYVYVFQSGERPTVYLRYESSSPILGSLSTGNGAFYVGTSSGLLSKFTVAERLGRIEWEYRSGDAKTTPPLIIGDSVYAASEAGKLVAIDDSNGLEKWAATRYSVDQPFAISGKVLFTTSRSGALLGFDKQSGALLGRSLPINISQPVVNALNDRVYVVTTAGQVQCLRPVGAELPTFIAPVAKPEAAPEEATQPAGQPNQNFGTNPFENSSGGGGGNPFESGAGAGNPFGGDAGGGNPFGGDTGGDAGGNPFGGDTGGDAGGNPFGGDTGGAAGGNPFGGSGSGDNPFGSGS